MCAPAPAPIRSGGGDVVCRPPVRRMRRVATIVCTFVVSIGVTAVAMRRAAAPSARQAGRAIYVHRVTVNERLRTASPGRAAVVWLADSTTMGRAPFPPYVPMVEAATRGPTFVLEGPGMDFYAYWSLAGRVVALRPEVVVVIANLRNFGSAGGPQGFNDLTAEIDLADLPRTLALPFSIRGMTAPRLLLARTLRTDAGADAFLVYEGLRRLAQDSPAWEILGPTLPEPPDWRLVHFVHTLQAVQADYARPFGRSAPLLAYADATVARLRRAGIRVLVVVTPMPWDLPGTHYDAEHVLARIALLRDVVERHGARLVDLHHALDASAFRDQDCHFTADGAARMAGLVAPEVGRLLAQAGTTTPERAP
jgi:hypothetical protein